MGKTQPVKISIRAKLLAFVTAIILLATFVSISNFTSTFSSSLRQELFNEARAFSALATKPLGDTYQLFKDSGTIRIVEEVDTLLANNAVAAATEC